MTPRNPPRDSSAQPDAAEPAADNEPVRPRRSGEAAWQAARDRVAKRNAQARKLGKEERRAHEQRIAGYRRAASDPD